jgi:tetratricopeptide (TPR) repeat protein
MDAGLRDRIQAALGHAYRIERELGGGGMSRVFVAQEVALGRTVALKVLSPELAAGISIERFNREIQLAARLQHPHVVPVHSAGAVDGLPYYTMPFVEGESLRVRLAKQGALPLRDVNTILRDVARALEYAHSQGVVHRDIKPDNVLMAGSSATVADFGIAKAISASRTAVPGATLTSAGTSIGTPSYIAPEQAAGDAGTDHRADLYSFGCMAYELLTGQAPFGDRPPAKLLVAHLSEKPENVIERRPDVAPKLAALVMQCLEKDPAHRPQNATDILHALDAVASSGGHDAGPAIALTTKRNLGKALAIYAASFIAVAILSRAAIIVIGLPDWVFPGSLIVMALGLPVILFTGLVHHQAKIARMQATFTPGGTMATHGTMTQIALKASPVLTWRRTAIGGAWSVGIFALMVGAWMLLRALGVGPSGSLLAAGALKQNDPILVSDFKSPARDTGLGAVVTEALRGELAQSKSMSIVPTSRIRAMLGRMNLDASARLDFTRAREMATREGIKAIVDGEVLAIGGSRVIQANLIGTQTGDVLASFKETAKTENDVVNAIDQLARDLRERVGESLKNIRATPPYERVTTASLDALRKFVDGQRTYDVGEAARGQKLLEEAIALDTSFAMAYRKLAVSYLNDGRLGKGWPLLQKAYDHRGRLSDDERLSLEGYYFTNGPRPDITKGIAAYEQLLELAPDDQTGLINLAVSFEARGENAKAEALFRRSVAIDTLTFQSQAGLIRNLGREGRLDEAGKVATTASQRLPRSKWQFGFATAEVLWGGGKLDSAMRVAEGAMASTAEPFQRATVLALQARIAAARGKLADADRFAAGQVASSREAGAPEVALVAALNAATRTAWYRGDRVSASRQLDEALKTTPLASIDPLDRPFGPLVDAQVSVGRVDAAKATLADFTKAYAAVGLLPDTNTRSRMEGAIALAEKKYDVAVAKFRERSVDMDFNCLSTCELPRVAQAFELGGKPDSAIAAYEKYLGTKERGRTYADAMFLGPSLKRLGELYEAKGDRENAAKRYAEFVDLWKNADPELQPTVKDVQSRLARLRSTEPSTQVTPTGGPKKTPRH